jgi:hypothetical protein
VRICRSSLIARLGVGTSFFGADDLTGGRESAWSGAVPALLETAILTFAPSDDVEHAERADLLGQP